MMFLFKFCPHSVLSSYLFAGSRSYFFFFLFFIFLSLSYSFLTYLGSLFQKRSASAGSFGCCLVSAPACSLNWGGERCFGPCEMKRSIRQIFFCTGCCSDFFFPHTFFSVRCRKFSSDTDVFSEAVLCGYYPPACQSPCPVKGCRCKAKEYQWI